MIGILLPPARRGGGGEKSRTTDIATPRLRAGSEKYLKGIDSQLKMILYIQIQAKLLSNH